MARCNAYIPARSSALEAAIEDLRIKYELKAAREAESAAAAAAAERVKGMTSDEVVAQDEAARENDWSVEDPELELLRQVRGLPSASYHSSQCTQSVLPARMPHNRTISHFRRREWRR